MVHKNDMNIFYIVMTIGAIFCTVFLGAVKTVYDFNISWLIVVSPMIFATVAAVLVTTGNIAYARVQAKNN